MPISYDNLIQSIRYSREYKYVYLNNPKAACSTVKRTLWSQHRGHAALETPNQIHSRKLWDEDFGDALFDDVFWFTVVRNPFARILSCYLDKIKEDNVIKKLFCQRYNLNYNRNISFNLFLETIQNEDPWTDDPHWRPQTINVLQPLARINFIGYVETLQSDLKKVFSRLFGKSLQLASQRDHARNATAVMDSYYGAKEINLVLIKYANDFSTFHYSDNIKYQSPLLRQSPILTNNKIFKLLLLAIGQKDCDDGYYWIRKLTKSFPEYVPALTIASHVANNLGDSDLAIELSRKALSLYPNDVDSLLEFGKALFLKGLYDDAIEHLYYLTSIRPEKQQHWVLLARCLLAVKRYSEARDAAQSASWVSPNQTDNAGLRLIKKIPT